MSIRFGSSSEVPRRAKVRRWRGASTGAKTAAPSERWGEGKTGAQSATRQDSTARHAPRWDVETAVTDPVPRPRGYVAERFQRDGCGYWPGARIPANHGFANGGACALARGAALRRSSRGRGRPINGVIETD